MVMAGSPDYKKTKRASMNRIDASHLPMRVQSGKNGYWGQTSRGRGHFPYKEVKNFLMKRVGRPVNDVFLEFMLEMKKHTQNEPIKETFDSFLDYEEEKMKAIAVTKAQQEFEVAELEAKKAKQVALKVQAEGEAKAAANRALVAAGLTPAERAEWDYKTAVGVAEALANSKVQWVPSVMFGGNGSGNNAMDAVGLKMLMDITKSFDKK